MSTETSLAEFWVIRHGETVWNATGQYQGHADIELSARGLEQCQRLAHRLEGLRFAAAYSSDLIRARHTAELAVSLLENSPNIVLEPRLREIDVGGLSGKRHTEIAEEFPDYFSRLRSDPWNTPRPGGESMADLYARVRDCMLELAERHAGERVLIFTHGGVVRVAVSLALGGSLQDVWARLSIENTSISRLHYSEAGGRLISFNDVGHLERPKDTEDDAAE